MEVKDFQFSIKGIDDAGVFTGLAAIYGVEDLQGDIIERGAFSRAIAQQGAGFPLLWAHKQDVPIGLAKLSDSERGPTVHGTIDREDPDGQTAYRRVKSGVVKGLSIGFTIPNPTAVKYRESVRHLSEIKLHEISLVSVPAQPGAQVLEVRSLGDAARVLGGFDAERMGAAEISALRMIEKHLARLLPADPSAAVYPALLADLRGLAKELRRGQ